MKNSKTAAPVLVILAAVCWGVIGLFSRRLSACGLSSVQITESRCIVTAVFLCAYLLIRDRAKLRIRLRDLWMFIGTGVLSIVFFNICYFISISENSLSVASILLYTAPCFVMLMSALFFRERVSAKKLLALAVAFAGCALTAGILGGGAALTKTGLLAGLGSGFGYALYSIFGRVALKRYHPFTVTAYTFIVAALSLLPFCHPAELIGLYASGGAAPAYGLLLGLISTLAPFLLYTKGLEQMEAGRASVIAFVEPMVACLLSVFYFREPITAAAVVGVVLIFGSVILLSIKEKARA